jgi:SAM-dependent methyltransferase
VPAALGVSHRRRLLDAELARQRGRFAGVVLEVGARRARRGRFRPPSTGVTAWLRLDIAEGERPDIVADVEHLPVRDGSADWVVCLEVLQYVASPDAAVREIARVLRPGGATVVSAPFLHRSDGPTDRHRFTEVRVRELLAAPGLRIERVTAQAAFFGTLANQLRQAVAQAPSRWVRWPLAAATQPLELALLAADRLAAVRRSAFLSSFSTGFVVVARKSTEGP